MLIYYPIKTMDTVIIVPDMYCCVVTCVSTLFVFCGIEVMSRFYGNTVSMYIDTVVLYVYQYCRSIDTNVNVHIKTADIVTY